MRDEQLYRRVMYGDLPDEYEYEPVEIDYEAAGWAHWNEERIGSASPNDPPFDNYEDFKDIWIERARMAIKAALGLENDDEK